MNRRDFIGSAALGALAVPHDLEAADGDLGQRGGTVPAAIQALQPMTAGVVPIGDDERRARVAKAQRLMEEQRIDAVFMRGAPAASTTSACVSATNR